MLKEITFSSAVKLASQEMKDWERIDNALVADVRQNLQTEREAMVYKLMHYQTYMLFNSHFRR